MAEVTHSREVNDNIGTKDLKCNSVRKCATGLKIPSIPKRTTGISLSDIIAATIGEEARSCETFCGLDTTDTSFDFLNSICGNDNDSVDGKSQETKVDGIVESYGAGAGNISNLNHAFHDIHDNSSSSSDNNKLQFNPGTYDTSTANGFERKSGLDQCMDTTPVGKDGLSFDNYMNISDSQMFNENSNNACDMISRVNSTNHQGSTSEIGNKTSGNIGLGMTINLGFDSELQGLFSPLRQLHDPTTAKPACHVTNPSGTIYI